MRKFFSIGFVLLLIALGGCRMLNTPHQSFEHSDVPPAPDYSDHENWSALPWDKDFADTVPQGFGLENKQESAPVDVFFLHPTTYKASQWNAPLDDERTNEKTDSRVILHQATAFNGTARIFAPRYRQLSYYGFFSKDTASKRKAISLAYHDLRSAFDHYMENWNDGRPLILVGHSQGALHGMNMLREVFSSEKMKDKLVIAYLPGWPVPSDKTGTIPVCKSADDLHCFVSWNTFAFGKGPRKRQEAFYKNATCVNPVSWKYSSDWSALPEHEGTLNADYDEIADSIMEAKCEEGVLLIKTDHLPLPYNWANNFHVADINLFWMDIREDVANRWKRYQGKSPSNN